jgi:hypothetical protein
VDQPERGVIGVRVLVVYESVMGNTRAIAESVAEGIQTAVPEADVRCRPAAHGLAEPAEADLVVVGGPTHFFGLPAERTRRMWVQGVLRRGREQGHFARLEPGATGPGVREWFEELAEPDADLGDCIAGARDLSGCPRAAAFDTRLDRPMAGSAARRIAHLLRRHGYQVIARPEGFIVEDMEGPLRAGERQRAVVWGAHLAAEAGLVFVPGT